MNFATLNLGRYAPGQSLLHRSDPRSKIILTLLWMSLLYGVESYPAFLLLSCFILFTGLLAGRTIIASARGLRPVLWLALCAALLNLLSVPGEPLATSGIFSHLSWAGLDLSAKMILRLVLLVSSASLLTLTTPPLALADGLAQLLKPLKLVRIPVEQLAMMLTLALRFMPMIIEEAERITKIQRSRSSALQGKTLRSRLNRISLLLWPLFVAVFRRGEVLATAMESRCYRGDMNRTRMKPLRFSTADLICGVVFLLLVALLFLIEYCATQIKY